MKNTSIVGLMIAGVAILQGCAGTVHPEKKSTATLLTGSEKLSVSSQKCPRGMGVIRVYRDTLNGDGTKFNAKMAITEKAIEKEMNVYSLLQENTITDGIQRHSNKPNPDKVAIKTDLTSIRFKFSDQQVSLDQGKLNATAPEAGSKALLNEYLGIQFDPTAGFYKKWGDAPDLSTIASVYVDINGTRDEHDLNGFSLPETIELSSEALKANEKLHPFNKKYSVESGKPLLIDIAPKKSTVAGTLLVQFMIKQKNGGPVAAYNYLVNEKPEQASIEVPTTGVGPGMYALNVFRSEIASTQADDGKDFCVELSTGFMSLVDISKPAPAKK